MIRPLSRVRSHTDIFIPAVLRQLHTGRSNAGRGCVDARCRAELDAARIEEIHDAPVDFPLTALQRIVSRTVREGRALVHGDVLSALARLVPPVRYLDFETFAPAIPRFAGTRSYDPIPFLFSAHTERNGSPPCMSIISTRVATTHATTRRAPHRIRDRLSPSPKN